MQTTPEFSDGADFAPLTVSDILDEAPTGRFHRRAVLVSGVGFFTDAYDLFVISTVAVLVSAQWHLSTTQTSWVTGSAILGAFLGALVFGRLADRIGRRPVYAVVAGLMILGALASALAPGFGWLVASRLVLGLGIGGDYPVSAVLMSEYANRRDRGRLVGMVFSMQAVGLVVGPIVAIALLGSGIGDDATWRILLALGAVPAAAVIWLRSRMPESPRFQAEVRGNGREALRDLSRFAGGSLGPAAPAPVSPRSSRAATAGRLIPLIVGTAGAWFLFDYAYYGNTLSLPAILSAVDPTASTIGKLALTLLMFVVFAVPGYLLAVWKMDRVGHRRLQSLGFTVMAVAFLVLGAFGPLTTLIAPFVAIFGLSYFFVEFGPNTTTFVLPAEVFPTRMRTTGHRIAAGLGKLGAFIGVFLVPQLQDAIGLRGMLVVAGGASVLGYLCTRLLPEPGQRSLDDVAPDRAPRAERLKAVAA
ncbi:MAG TPA: MFS transporter [Acidimicrobiales bacterium]|nr:MFS transporter [Acidimicrobiales bacterium]